MKRQFVSSRSVPSRPADRLRFWRDGRLRNCQPLWEEWRRIIEQRLWNLAVEESDRGQQLRQASPLAFVLSEEQRAAIFDRFRRIPKSEP